MAGHESWRAGRMEGQEVKRGGTMGGTTFCTTKSYPCLSFNLTGYGPLEVRARGIELVSGMPTRVVRDPFFAEPTPRALRRSKPELQTPPRSGGDSSFSLDGSDGRLRRPARTAPPCREHQPFMASACPEGRAGHGPCKSRAPLIMLDHRLAVEHRSCRPRRSPHRPHHTLSGRVSGKRTRP